MNRLFQLLGDACGLAAIIICVAAFAIAFGG